MNKDAVKIVTVFYLICLFVYGIVGLVLSIKAYVGFSSLSTQFDLLLKNWNKDIINQIQTTTGDCPSGYKSLIKYTWPGTMSGCDCRYISSYNREKYRVYGTLNSGSCTRNETIAGCRRIASQQSSSFKRWNDHYKLCGKELDGYDFKKKHLDADGKCRDANHKLCGGTNANNKFCVPMTESCPITSIVISDKNPDTKLYNDSLSFHSNKNVYFSRITDDSPIVQTTISEGLVCKDYRNINISPGHYNYYLLRYKRVHCSDTDLRWKALDSIGESTFFNVNGKSYLPSSLPTFSLSNNYIYYLYSRTIIPWKLNCIKFVDKLFNNESNYKSAFNAQLALMIVNILACIALSIVLQASEIGNLLGCDVPCIQGKGEEEHMYIKCIKRVVNYLFKLIQFPCMIVAVVKSKRIKVLTGDIALMSCSDSMTNDTFSSLAYEMKNTCYKKNIQMLIMFAVMVVLDILLELVRCYAAYKARENSEKKSLNQELQSKNDLY